MQPFLIAALLLVAFTAYGADKSSPRLNVLYIVSDDLNASLGCYGSSIVKSPNIDRLATRGVRFDRAYCNYPVCNASRSSFLSGRRPDTTRIVDNLTPPRTFLKDAVFLPEHFRQQGYRTIKVGKIFHTGDEFEDPRSWDVDIRETSLAKNPPAALANCTSRFFRSLKNSPSTTVAASARAAMSVIADFSRVPLASGTEQRRAADFSGFTRPAASSLRPSRSRCAITSRSSNATPLTGARGSGVGSAAAQIVTERQAMSRRFTARLCGEAAARPAVRAYELFLPRKIEHLRSHARLIGRS